MAPHDPTLTGACVNYSADAVLTRKSSSLQSLSSLPKKSNTTITFCTDTDSGDCSDAGAATPPATKTTMPQLSALSRKRSRVDDKDKDVALEDHNSIGNMNSNLQEQQWSERLRSALLEAAAGVYEEYVLQQTSANDETTTFATATTVSSFVDHIATADSNHMNAMPSRQDLLEHLEHHVASNKSGLHVVISSKNKRRRMEQSGNSSSIAADSSASCKGREPCTDPTAAATASSKTKKSTAKKRAPRKKGGGRAAGYVNPQAAETVVAASVLARIQYDASNQQEQEEEYERQEAAAAAKKKQRDANLQAAKAHAATAFAEAKQQASFHGRPLPKGALEEVLAATRTKFALEPDQKLSKNTIRQRVLRGNLGGKRMETPMSAVEPKLVEMVLKQEGPIERGEFLRMANHLIAGTELEKQVVAWKVHHCGYDPANASTNANTTAGKEEAEAGTADDDGEECDNNDAAMEEGQQPRAQLGIKYYRGFLRRHADRLAHKIKKSSSSSGRNKAIASSSSSQRRRRASPAEIAAQTPLVPGLAVVVAETPRDGPENVAEAAAMKVIEDAPDVVAEAV